MAQAIILLEDSPDGTIDIAWDFTDGGGVDPKTAANNTIAQQLAVHVLEFIAELMDKKAEDLYRQAEAKEAMAKQAARRQGSIQMAMRHRRK